MIVHANLFTSNGSEFVAFRGDLPHTNRNIEDRIFVEVDGHDHRIMFNRRDTETFVSTDPAFAGVKIRIVNK